MLRIAIADDHTLFRKSLYLLINSFEGVEVVAKAGNGFELLEVLATVEADILLLDLQMPQMDGFSTCEKIKALYPKLKIMILTQLDDAETIRQVLKMGVQGYFTKNTAPKELEDAIWKLQDDGFYFEKNLTSIVHEIQNNGSLKFNEKQEVIFTAREKEILSLTAMGYKAKEIADRLFISTKTVNAHKQNIQQKYGFETMMSAIMYCIHHRIISV
jgi:DNA-binding NarL/FixJ family response regulator